MIRSLSSLIANFCQHQYHYYVSHDSTRTSKAFRKGRVLPRAQDGGRVGGDDLRTRRNHWECDRDIRDHDCKFGWGSLGEGTGTFKRLHDQNLKADALMIGNSKLINATQKFPTRPGFTLHLANDMEKLSQT